MSIMSTTGTTYGDEGMNLNLNSNRSTTTSEMENMFDQLFTSFQKKLKLEDNIPSSSDVDMNIPQAEPNRKYMFDPVPIMHKTLSFRQNLDRLDGLIDFTTNMPSGVNEPSRATRERASFVFGDQFQSSDLGNELHAVSSFSNAETQSQPLQFLVPELGEFNVGTYNSFPQPQERRHKWMFRNRGSDGRSRARRLGLMENRLQE